MSNPAQAAPFFHVGSVKLSPTTSSVRAQLPTVGSQAILYNAGPDIAFIDFGGSGVVAQVPNNTTTTGSLTLPPLFTQVIYTRDTATDTYAAAICASGSAAVYIDIGNGS